MKICVYGAGAIGGYLAGFLAKYEFILAPNGCGALRTGGVSAPPLQFVHLDSPGGQQSITALSEGEGTAKAGVRGCYLRAEPANPSPTASRPPLSRKRARAVVN